MVFANDSLLGCGSLEHCRLCQLVGFADMAAGFAVAQLVGCGASGSLQNLQQLVKAVMQFGALHGSGFSMAFADDSR